MKLLASGDLQERFAVMRELSEKITAPLEREDYVLQAVEEVSPAKWHLAHTTWFFEEFILSKWIANYEFYLKDARKLFNSYYETLSKPFPRDQRGLISRPTVDDIYNYRAIINERMKDLLESAVITDELQHLMELGIQHEQQHQELLLTDIKYNLSINPQEPIFKKEAIEHGKGPIEKFQWLTYGEGLVSIGTNNHHFSFDNERPSHYQYLYDFQLANRPVTNKEFLTFIEDGGYKKPEYWLSDGWKIVQEQQWEAPLYWNEVEGTLYTLGGRKRIPMNRPVQHVSFYEADAYARWASARLPSEAEWEIALGKDMKEGTTLEETLEGKVTNLPLATGHVWEWTASPYTSYPQSARPDGALGEYNMKFMSNQMVLRGGSAYTPSGHIRPTYRNFFPADKRWQCTGFRLAKNGGQI
ncbi:ergothioneine biosynthesis protein EgtB [Alkalicoccus saliphilus]|uniref:Ergothioneine biosynthesis protein EgtB n=1 Tax=Alkalicoccus saliphilus TaxID=200989 RepID=A0A2T4U6P3_9BACI|nr:ergothioneine biosynthesis protein EgtB [Alkalicoccus saliphilus]PTL39066.1 ergothioneine biosynthesis protein EgtB [Alkalicoccus saliphilus]